MIKHASDTLLRHNQTQSDTNAIMTPTPLMVSCTSDTKQATKTEVFLRQMQGEILVNCGHRAVALNAAKPLNIINHCGTLRISESM